MNSVSTPVCRASTGYTHSSRPENTLQTFRGYENTLSELFERRRNCQGRGSPAQYDYQLKTAASKALMAAKDWIDEGGLDNVNQKELAERVSSFSKLRKHPVTQITDDILECIAQGVLARFSEKQLCRWDAIVLARMTNGFSKCTRKGVSQVLALLARSVSKQAARPTAQADWPRSQFTTPASAKKPEGLPEEKGWNAQDLAMMANALGNGKGSDVQQALGYMAMAINERKDDLTEGKGWKAQPLSMMANGLSKAEGKDVRDNVQQALGHMAKAINKRKDSLTEAKGWNAQPLAMMANGLSKAEGADVWADVQQALGHMAKVINKRKDSLTEAKGWNAQPLVMMANGLSKAEGADVWADVQQALGHMDQPMPAERPASGHDGQWPEQSRRGRRLGRRPAGPWTYGKGYQ